MRESERERGENDVAETRKATAEEEEEEENTVYPIDISFLACDALSLCIYR